ncbi:unnamed protein product, partial [Meganyctiphanes norvegica]
MSNNDLLVAVKGSNPTGVRQALDLGASPNTTDQYGWPVLRLALRKDMLTEIDVAVIQHLLHETSLDIDYIGGDSRSYTALMDAAYRGHTDVCHRLLQRGAAPDITTSDSGHTAIWLAAYGGHRQAMEVIISYSGDLHKKDKWGRSPAQAARG